MTRQRLDRATRKDQLLCAAIPLSEELGYASFSRETLAAKADCSNAQVSLIFGSVAGLRDAIVERAIERRNLPIIAQALANRHHLTVSLTPEVLEAVQAHLFPNT